MKHDWEYKKLGEVAEIIGGSTPKTNIKEYWDGDYFWITPAELKGDRFIKSTSRTITDLAVENTNLSLLPKGTVLLSSRAPIGKVAIADVPMYCNQGFKNIICGEKLNNNYVYWLLYGKTEYLNSLGVGATFKEISKKIVENIPIPLPPLSTQQSIVSELDSLSKIIADCKETLKDYDALEQSIFYDMFGDPVKNEKGWEVKKLEDICSNIVDCPHSTPTKSDVPTIYPCIRTSELRNGEIYWDSMQYVEEEEYKNRIVRLQPQKDDIVFGREGSIGGAVILPEGYQFCLGQRTMLLRVDESIIHSIFLHRVILSDWVKNQIMDKNVASTVAHVNVKDVKAFLIPIPPLPLQQQFASKIEAIEQMKSETKKALQEAETLFQARMDYWFN